MKKLVAAVAAALVVVVAASAALAADPPVKVKLVRTHYVITGTASDATGGTVMDIEVTQHGHTIGGPKYTPPTAANDWAFRVVMPKKELPAGNYVLVLADIIPGSKPKLIKFRFAIA
ncbi:MAG TPA: hypothetical protein VFA37_07375 [Gaiellaceae bacterium]|nr:hypothetical protein [Gaiellaceae bacterium]